MKAKVKRTFGEEDMPHFIQIIVICTKVINHTTDWLQQWTEHDAPTVTHRTRQPAAMQWKYYYLTLYRTLPVSPFSNKLFNYFRGHSMSNMPLNGHMLFYRDQ